MNKPEELYGDLFYEQLNLEDTYKNLAQEAAKRLLEDRRANHSAATSSLGQRFISHQFDTVLDNVKAFMEYTLKPKPGVKRSYFSIVENLMRIYEGQEEQLYNIMAVLPFSVLINRTMSNDLIYSNLLSQVANELEQEVKTEAFLQTLNGGEVKSLLSGISERVARSYKALYVERRMKHSGFHWDNWERQDAVLLAAELVQLVIAGSGYFEEYRDTTREGNSLLEIRPTQWLLDAWAKNEESMIARAYRLCPTVIPPAPWESIYEGGYYGSLRSSCALLRSDSLRYARQRDTRASNYLGGLNELDLTNVLTALNSIQETPWAINKKVLEVLKAIIDRGGEIGGVPRLEPLEELPRLPHNHSEEELIRHKKKAVELVKQEARRRSRAIRTLGHYRVAKEFAKYERIYFPHNMDFRGRVYPIPTFNPQGDDINKGLLLFADVPACESMEDIEWLMVHGANLAGVDKVSFEDRKKWVLEYEEQILLSAADPMGYRWWADQDSPFQLLAFCFEWAKWKDYHKTHGTAKGFITGIPIAFDGTCSGLQHFSAILRDPVGGKAVNLIPGDKPNDIYGVVAEKVNEWLKKDAAKGSIDTEAETKQGGKYLKFGTKTLAQQWLLYGVTRKVTKRPVMTLAYGSKEYGFREQILNDIIEPAIDEGRGSMFIDPFQAANYMAKLIWKAVQQVVVKAVEGMDWLKKVARLLCNDGWDVRWITPMNFVVRQAYTKTKAEKINLYLRGSIRRHFYDNRSTGKTDKRAQASAVAPNFIHSMDAAHLQLTILLAREAGIRHFAMVHDSYGAPAAQAGIMFKTVREAFYQMYVKIDALQDFFFDLECIEDKSQIPPAPEKGSLNLEDVKRSLYMFA